MIDMTKTCFPHDGKSRFFGDELPLNTGRTSGISTADPESSREPDTRHLFNVIPSVILDQSQFRLIMDKLDRLDTIESRLQDLFHGSTRKVRIGCGLDKSSSLLHHNYCGCVTSPPKIETSDCSTETVDETSSRYCSINENENLKNEISKLKNLLHNEINLNKIILTKLNKN
jgi:hypothetical protein